MLMGDWHDWKKRPGKRVLGAPFLSAFCFSALRWAAAGFRVRSLSLAMAYSR